MFELQLVSRSDERYQDIRDRHYVPNHGTIGRQLHYLITRENKPIGIITGASPVWATASRDQFFGINNQNREEIVGRYIVNNTVFRLEIQEYNLGSQILAQWRKRCAHDWQERYGDPVLGFETFIYGENRHGSLYLADNWFHVGETAGNTKFKPHGAYNETVRKETERKLVFVRWVDKRSPRRLLEILSKSKRGNDVIAEIELEKLVIARDSAGDILNPRGENFTSTDIQDSFRQSGQHDEVKVVQLSDDEYLLLDGHRRLQAAVALGWKTLRASIQDIGTVSDTEILARMIGADVRQPLKPSQLAAGMKNLMLHKRWPLERVAALRGLKIDRARLYLDILNAPESVQKRIDSGEMSLSAFEALRNQPVDVQEKAAQLEKPTRDAVRSTVRQEAGRAASVGQMTDLLSQVDAESHNLVQVFRGIVQQIENAWEQLLPHEQEAVDQLAYRLVKTVCPQLVPEIDSWTGLPAHIFDNDRVDDGEENDGADN